MFLFFGSPEDGEDGPSYSPIFSPVNVGFFARLLFWLSDVLIMKSSGLQGARCSDRPERDCWRVTNTEPEWDRAWDWCPDSWGFVWNLYPQELGDVKHWDIYQPLWESFVEELIQKTHQTTSKLKAIPCWYLIWWWWNVLRISRAEDNPRTPQGESSLGDT